MTVGYAIADGTATAGEDYTEPGDTLTIALGATTKTLPDDRACDTTWAACIGGAR